MARALRWSRRTCASTGRDEDGAVAVEFALVVIPLMFMFFGIIGFGFLFSQQLSLSHAAREAARYGSVASFESGTWKPHTCADVIARAREAAQSMAIPDPTRVVVAVARDGAACSSSTSGPCTGGTNNSTVEVRLNYDSGLLIPLMSWNGKVDAVGVFRCEYK